MEACAKDVWRVAQSEKAVVVPISYLPDCINGVSKRPSTDPRIHHGRSVVIVPVSPAIRQLVHDYRFFHIVRGTLFDTAFECVAYCR